MLGKFRFLVILAMFCPTLVFGADDDAVSETEDTEITEIQNDEQTQEIADIHSRLSELDWGNSENPERKELYDKIESLMNDLGKTTDDLRKNYEDLKANEQSLANRTLTAVTTAATGIGGMELAMGLSQQKADKEADQNMAAYIATMRCTYGDGKSVKAGLEEIELPGGNDEELMNLRTEYFALAADLKVRKEALGMKPGIESEKILDKSKMGLYDDEYKGIETGAYESLYRATMLGSEADQAKIAEERDASKKRVIGGAVAAGAGVVAGIAGNMIINKDAPKNRASEIKSRRANIQKEIDSYLHKELERCNNMIDENQKLANTIKGNSKLMKDSNIKDYVEKVSKLNKLTDIKDISVIKDHPLCK